MSAISMRLEALREAEAECVAILRERLSPYVHRMPSVAEHRRRTRKAIAVIRALRREIARLSGERPALVQVRRRPREIPICNACGFRSERCPRCD